MVSYPELKGKTAIVTGAAAEESIGEAIALAMAAQGARVAIIDIDEAGSARTAQKIKDAGGEGITVRCDVTSRDSVQAMVKSVVDATGRIDVLVNCAGGFFFTETADQVTEERWDFIVDLNMKSVFLCSQAVYDTMKEQKSGCIVNISSSAGRMPVQSAPVHYAAAKAGVISLTQVMARELAGFGVRVNAVAPGTTPTQRVVKLRGTSDPEVLKAQIARVPLGRMASVEDSTAAALFLASDQASFITGHTIDVNGGVLMF